MASMTCFDRLILNRPVNKMAALHTHIPVKAIPLHVFESREIRREQTTTFEIAVAGRAALPEVKWNGDELRQRGRFGCFRLAVTREHDGYRATYSRHHPEPRVSVRSKRLYITMDAAKRVLVRIARNETIKMKSGGI